MHLFRNRSNITFFFGFVLCLLFVFLLYLSKDFSTIVPLLERPILILVWLLVLSSLVYFVCIKFKFQRLIQLDKKFWILAIGLIIRILTIFSVPILEDDYFRYLWDGAVTASGNNPYKYSPAEVVSPGFEDNELSELALQSKDVIKNVNHPHLKTIYPPVAQLFFALSHKIASFDIYFWRVVLLIFDIITFFLLIKILQELNLSIYNIIIYWWNPLLVKEIFNSGHFEVLVFPFVLGSLFFATRQRYLPSVISLAIAVGVKIWPIFLFPLILRPLFKKPAEFVKVGLVFGLTLALIFLPVFLAGFDTSSGYLAYGKSWENNSSVFRVFLFGFEAVSNSINIHPIYAQYFSRVFILVLILLWVFYLTFRRDKKEIGLYNNVLLVVASIFLLSPTQFPWYYTWMIPFLAITPRWSLLILTLLLPLYYLRYYLEPRENLDFFNNVIVWIEFVPVWVLLFLEWLKGNSRFRSL